MRRTLLASLAVLLLPGCWPAACVAPGPTAETDICTDGVAGVFDDEDTADARCADGEEHEFATCSSLGFTRACGGGYRVRPGGTCG